MNSLSQVELIEILKLILNYTEQEKIIWNSDNIDNIFTDISTHHINFSSTRKDTYLNSFYITIDSCTYPISHTYKNSLMKYINNIKNKNTRSLLDDLRLL